MVYHMHESNWSGWSWLLWGLYFTAAFPIEVGSEPSEVEAGSRMVSSRPDMRKIRSGCLKVVMEATQSWGSPSARAAGFRTVHHFTVMFIMSKCVTWCSQSLFRWGRPAAKGSRSVEKLTTGLFFFFFFTTMWLCQNRCHTIVLLVNKLSEWQARLW